MAIGTGHGATIALTTSAFTASILEIGSFTQSREAINTSHLGTTGFHTKRPGDLIDAGSFPVRYLFDPANGPPAFSDPEAAIINYPGPGGGTIAGSAFLTEVESPTFVTDQLMEGTYMVTWDGVTGPTFTDAT